ncbi:hypothetical protein NQ315_002008 [Exocentrus adspersus]|uniref:malate dehydrogenase n=1 Tax=Exocentrus adspersus TaxID=1586481 RepID=A0AAV8WAA6_9CUCU|nr:hypothetical protein NQ315_002008 [Exocentrus adspersus]
MNIYNYTKNKLLQSSYKRFLSTTQTEQEFQKYVQVTVLGAHSPLGRFTSLLLKQNPLVSVLRLQGDNNVNNLAVDLSYIDTKCKVQAFAGPSLEIVSKSIRSSDIILLLGVENLKEDTTIAERVMREGKRVYEVAKQCISYSPRSIIVVAVPPVSVTTILVEQAFKQSHWYHPGRIVGSAAIAQAKANTLMARGQDLNPQICKVPILGGPDVDLAVPLFSKAIPVELPESHAKQLSFKYRGIKEHEFPKIMGYPNYVETCPSAEAFALWNLISNIALGLCGDQNAYCNVYVRTNLMNLICKHLVTTVKFSRGGIVHNCGIPPLTKLELQMFERAALDIKKREKIAGEFVEYLEKGRSQPPPFKQKEIQEKKILQQTVVR